MSNPLKQYDTANYKIEVLGQESIEKLKDYGQLAAAQEGIIPNVYGILNRHTEVYEYYCSNLATAVSVQNTLEQGIQDEMENRPKKKADLRSV